MEVLTNTIYASEAFLSMSFPGKNLRKNYVPFVAPTDASKRISPARVGHIDRRTCQFAVVPLTPSGSAPIVRPRLKKS
jgi:hypothetical protein